jgi:hypothetical protein
MATQTDKRVTCRACGGVVQLALTTDDEQVPLELHTEPTGPKRYTVLGFTPLTVVRIPDGSAKDGYQDHRVECPDYNDGRRAGTF